MYGRSLSALVTPKSPSEGNGDGAVRGMGVTSWSLPSPKAPKSPCERDTLWNLAPRSANYTQVPTIWRVR